MAHDADTIERPASTERDVAGAAFLRSLPAPEPSMGSAAYAAQRERALAFDPRRRSNYEKYLRARTDRSVVDYLPIKHPPSFMS